jgi:hypothetical protein
MNGAADRISRRQLRALQTLFGLYARRTIDADADLRRARLEWASASLGRTVASFTELLGDEAARLISTLKQSLGQESTRARRRPLGREAARAAGTHGRKNRRVDVEMLATREEIAVVDEMRQRVGMTPEDFETWLKSRSSPIRGRAVPQLRTVSDCNRVCWALKAILKRQQNAAA